jgi:O-antigen biosynthesis protein
MVTSQLLGFDAVGGVGAATAWLALALGRMGHEVRLLYTQQQHINPMDSEWARRYDEAGVRVQTLPLLDVPVEPRGFARLRAVELALRASPPDVVIVHDYGAPAYIAMRLRQLGLAFQDTRFVVYCHGTGPWHKEVTRNARMSTDMLAFARLEQAGVELADLVVSPSGYLVEWMRRKGWRLPETRVIPLVTRPTAMGEPSRALVDRDAERPVERIVYFGRLEERKGIRPFAAGLNVLAPELLDGIDVEFLGGATKDWAPERVSGLLSERTRHTVRQVSFETELGQEEALARLSRPGTLAVIPSLAENSPNVVYECLEAQIPFLASAAGGIPELIAPEDRRRVLFPPTVEGVSAALHRALAEGGALRSVRPAFEGADVLRAWGDAVAPDPRGVAREFERPAVDAVVAGCGPADPCLVALEAQGYEHLKVIPSASREEGLRAGTAEWVVFLDAADVPRPDFVEVLVQAQAASGADAVSCAVVRDEREHFFLGEPGGVGLLSNAYGAAPLVRRSLLGEMGTNFPVHGDQDWPLLARLNAAGAHVVSVPLPLLSRSASPGTIEHDPSDALLVVDAFEAALPHQLRPLARLAAALAAETRRLAPPPEKPPLSRRLRSRARRLLGRR